MLERDGRVHARRPKPPNDLGVVPRRSSDADDADRHDRLRGDRRAAPFTGECPTAFDGQEIVFEFATARRRSSTIASCEVGSRLGPPLFVAVSTALGPFIALPTT